MSQNLIFLSITLLIFSISGCEKPQAPDLSQSNQKEREETMPPVLEVEIESEPSLQTSAPQISPTEKPAPLIKTPVKGTIITEPVVPSFSKELLKAVNNWENIPKSIFPLHSIQLSEDVYLEAKTQSGQVIATSIAPKGSKVTALGFQSGKLIIANPKNTKLNGKVEMDKSDFKQMVSYLFDYRNKQREQLKQKAQSREGANVQPTKSSAKMKTTEDSDFIPDPLDFGHGRFCICKDCREKRLAQSGSLKTGFGVEP